MTKMLSSLAVPWTTSISGFSFSNVPNTKASRVPLSMAYSFQRLIITLLLLRDPANAIEIRFAVHPSFSPPILSLLFSHKATVGADRLHPSVHSLSGRRSPAVTGSCSIALFMYYYAVHLGLKTELPLTRLVSIDVDSRFMSTELSAGFFCEKVSLFGALYQLRFSRWYALVGSKASPVSTTQDWCTMA